MSGLPSLLVSLVSLALLILGTVTCVSLIRLSVFVRSGGQKHAIWGGGIRRDEDDDEDDEDEPVQRYRPRRRPTGL